MGRSVWVFRAPLSLLRPFTDSHTMSSGDHPRSMCLSKLRAPRKTCLLAEGERCLVIATRNYVNRGGGVGVHHREDFKQAQQQQNAPHTAVLTCRDFNQKYPSAAAICALGADNTRSGLSGRVRNDDRASRSLCPFLIHEFHMLKRGFSLAQHRLSTYE
jgi:hypothetical protein